MGNATTMKYGEYEFVPVPLVTLSKSFETTEDGQIIGAVRTISLEGTLTPLPSGTTGYINVDALQDSLLNAFDIHGRRFEIMCGASTLLEAYPRINSVELLPSNNQWVMTTPFTIQMEYDETNIGVPPYIRSASETWNIEFVEDTKYFSIDLSTVEAQHQAANTYYGTDENPYQLRVTHNISAQGKLNYTGVGESGSLTIQPWEQARNYVAALMGFDSTQFAQSGVLNLNASLFAPYDHFRTVEVDELGGSYQVSESWVVINTGVNDGGSGTAAAVEDFTMNVNRSATDGLTTVSIDGSIIGLETRSYGNDPAAFSVSQAAFTAAEEYWSTVQSRLLSRAQYAGQSIATRTLNSTILQRSLGYSPSKGTISYTYEYNDRPCDLVSGALSEDITIIDNHPADVFAKIPVLGRAAGPVLQDIGTITEATREVSINIVVAPPSSCTVAALQAAKPNTEVEDALCVFETELTDVNDQVFKTSDVETWNPKSGNYSRQVAWTYQSCTVIPSSSFCP